MINPAKQAISLFCMITEKLNQAKPRVIKFSLVYKEDGFLLA